MDESSLTQFLAQFFAKEIDNALTGFSTTFGPIAAALASVGLLAMALIEFGKEVLGLRRWWNEKWIGRWLAKRTPENDRDDVLAQLHQLATGGDIPALYGQPTEKLVGQINAALQMALENPEIYAPFILALAHNAHPSDVALVLDGRPPISPGEISQQAREKLELYVEARNRVASHFQRSLDGIVISMASQWKRRLHIWSVVVSSVFIFLGAGVFREGPIGSTGDILLWILVAIAGGLLAPMINDLAKALKPKQS